MWRTIIDALSAPVPGPGGERDERTAAQRRHDALHEAGLRLLRSGTLPDAGGTPVTVLIRTTDADFADPDGVAVTDRGQILSLAQVWQLLDEAELVAVGYDVTGAVRECARQHHHRHFQRLGWVVTMINAQPVSTPPPWIGPAGTDPRHRHPPDIDVNAHRQPNPQPA